MRRTLPSRIVGLCIVLGMMVVLSIHLLPGALLLILTVAVAYVIADYAVYVDRKTRAVPLGGPSTVVFDDEV